jgi:hypothetical protein
LTGEEQPWANPPDGVILIQKVDPLARKPYTIESKQAVNQEDSTHKDKVYLDPTPDQINRVINRMSKAANKDL